MVGEDTMFRCHLSPEKSAEDMEVRWFRAQFSPAVLLYKGGRERPEEQMEEYRGRTTFVSEDIGRGSVALTVHNVTAHDNGVYRCYFQQGRSYDDAVMRLVVAGTWLRSVWFLFRGVVIGASFSPDLRCTADGRVTAGLLLGILFNRGGLLPPARGPPEWVRSAELWPSSLEKHTLSSAAPLSRKGWSVPTGYSYAPS